MNKMQNANICNFTGIRPAQRFRSMLVSVWPSRYIAYRLFLKDLRSQLAKAKLGLIWDFLDPLSMAGVFTALYYLGIVHDGQNSLSYPTYVTFGLLLYQAYSEACNISISTISRHKLLITQQPVKPEALLLANIYRFIFYGAIRCCIMLVVAIVQKELSFAGFLLFLMLYPTIVIFGMALGTLLSPFDVLYNDVGRGVVITLNVMRFATPVIWVFPHDKFPLLYKINPVAAIIDLLRTLATQGTIPYWHEAALWFSGHLVVLVVAWYIFHVAVVLLAEQA